jgi:hypothetical protein
MEKKGASKRSSAFVARLYGSDDGDQFNSRVK